MTGVSPSGPGSRASHEAASASSPKASIPNALTDQEHYYLHSILRSLRGLETRVCEDWQGVSLQSEALSDNIDWLDCYIEARCPTRGNCEQCWPKEMAA
jgi:hypothetical protein